MTTKTMMTCFGRPARFWTEKRLGTHADRTVTVANRAPVVTATNLPQVLGSVREQLADLTRRTEAFVSARGERFAEVEKRLFLTPDGQLEATLVETGAQQFAEPVSPWAKQEAPVVPDDGELARLRRAVVDAQAALREAKARGVGQVELSRLRLALERAERAVVAAEYRLGRGPRPAPGESVPHYGNPA